MTTRRHLLQSTSAGFDCLAAEIANKAVNDLQTLVQALRGTAKFRYVL